MIAREPEEPHALSKLEAGDRADEAGDDGEVLGGAEVCAPVEGVEEDEGKDSGFEEEESEPEDDGALAGARFEGVVERGRFVIEEYRIESVVGRWVGDGDGRALLDRCGVPFLVGRVRRILRVGCMTVDGGEGGGRLREGAMSHR